MPSEELVVTCLGMPIVGRKNFTNHGVFLYFPTIQQER